MHYLLPIKLLNFK